MKNQSEKKRSTASWLWVFTEGRRGEYLASVLAALIGVACSLVPYVIMLRLIQALVGGSADRAWCLKQCLVMGRGGYCAISCMHCPQRFPIMPPSRCWHGSVSA